VPLITGTDGKMTISEAAVKIDPIAYPKLGLQPVISKSLIPDMAETFISSIPDWKPPGTQSFSSASGPFFPKRVLCFDLV